MVSALQVDSALNAYIKRMAPKTYSAPVMSRQQPVASVRILHLPKIYADMVFMSHSKENIIYGRIKHGEDPLGQRGAKRWTWLARQTQLENEGSKHSISALQLNKGMISPIDTNRSYSQVSTNIRTVPGHQVLAKPH